MFWITETYQSSGHKFVRLVVHLDTCHHAGNGAPGGFFATAQDVVTELRRNNGVRRFLCGVCHPGSSSRYHHVADEPATELAGLGKRDLTDAVAAALLSALATHERKAS